MRLPTIAVLALTTTFSAVNARVLHSLLSRDVTTDVCASLANVLLTVKLSANAPPVPIGRISTCLCISGIPGFMTTNVVAIAATAVVGQAQTAAALAGLISSSTSHQTCTYPSAVDTPVCTTSNVCGFTCKDGFIPFPSTFPTQCTCASPNIVCNGKCTSASACSSPVSAPVKRDIQYARRNSVCESGYSTCGVFGKSQAWECIDTQSDLESCGGCTTPLTLGSPHGTDCTAIQGVSDVACVRGHCVVERCLAGYTLSPDSSFCARNEDLEAALENALLASSYGLEHVPLVKQQY